MADEKPVDLPGAPGNNPFENLPFPSPGDRIKSDDFKQLSQSLKVISDTYALSSALFGRNFGEAKLILTSQQYEIQKGMSVFGTEIGNLEDASLDNRKVIQIVPAILGERKVIVILTEAVETRRFAPNLRGLTYKEASERLRTVLGNASFAGSPAITPKLKDLSLGDIPEALNKQLK